ncbi:MAG: hypothetical protein ABI895_04070 [Deltaproteobacteria bacterium]
MKNTQLKKSQQYQSRQRRARPVPWGLLSFRTLGLGLAAAVLSPPSYAQSAGTLCPAGGFDVCFPNLEAGAPNAACTAGEAGARAITACLRSVCQSAAAEPEPGFFSYCCARGGSVRYDDFCVFVVQSECAAVAEHCVNRCPPVELLTGTVTLAPPPAACIEGYPEFIAEVCEADPFCCSTSWDSICGEAAVAASASVELLAVSGAALSPAALSSAALSSAALSSAALSSAAAPKPAVLQSTP